MSRSLFLGVACAILAASPIVAQYNVVAPQGIFTSIELTPGSVLIGPSDDGTFPFTLPFSFPWYEGPVTNIRVAANGALIMNAANASLVSLSPNTITSPPRIGVAQADLNSMTGGGIFSLNTGSSIIFSWENVPFFPAVGSVNAQVELFPNGAIEIRYGTNVSLGDDIHCGPAGPGLNVSASSQIPEFDATSATSGGVLPQNAGVRFTLIPTAPQFQPNSSTSNLTIDGQVTRSICPNEFAFINAATTLVGSPFEILVNNGPRIALANGGSATAGLQTYNLDLSPNALAFLNLALGSGFLPPHPGSVTFAFFGGAPFIGSAQQLVLDPSSLDLFTLSAAAQLETGVPTAPPSGTITGDDTFRNLVVGGNAFPGCINGPLVPFAGTLFTQIGLDSNGRITFTGSGSDFSPTTGEALGRALVGYWTDFNQGAGGTISFSADPINGFQISWNGVPYFADIAAPQNLSIAIDTAGVITIDVSGIVPRAGNAVASAFLGLSAGPLVGTATNPGSTAFGIGSGSNAAASDMLYAFGSTGGVGGILPEIANLQTGSGLLIFTPGTAPGAYTWLGL